MASAPSAAPKYDRTTDRAILCAKQLYDGLALDDPREFTQLEVSDLLLTVKLVAAPLEPFPSNTWVGYEGEVTNYLQRWQKVYKRTVFDQETRTKLFVTFAGLVGNECQALLNRLDGL